MWPAPPVEPRERLAIEFREGKAHDGTLDIPVQRIIVARALAWIESLYPRAAASGGR